MSKHTPGPWHITRDDLDSGEIAWHVFAEKGNVCRMYRRDADDIRAGAGSAKADACLIAAAPDLLAVCADLVEMNDAGVPCPPRLVVLARMAVAKARGEP